jgi:hypothetical protein
MECVDLKLSTIRSKHLAHSRETLISHVMSGVKCVIFGSENTVTGTLGIAQRSGGGGGGVAKLVASGTKYMGPNRVAQSIQFFSFYALMPSLVRMCCSMHAKYIT